MAVNIGARKVAGRAAVASKARSQRRCRTRSRRDVWAFGPARESMSSEAIARAARHHVHMQVRHALADAVVDGDEGTMGLQTALKRPG